MDSSDPDYLGQFIIWVLQSKGTLIDWIRCTFSFSELRVVRSERCVFWYGALCQRVAFHIDELHYRCSISYKRPTLQISFAHPGAPYPAAFPHSTGSVDDCHELSCFKIVNSDSPLFFRLDHVCPRYFSLCAPDKLIGYQLYCLKCGMRDDAAKIESPSS